MVIYSLYIGKARGDLGAGQCILRPVTLCHSLPLLRRRTISRNENRQAVGDSLKLLIDERTVLWGVDVESVEIKDIFVQDQEIRLALMRQAAARVDAQAKVTTAEGEKAAAEVFNEAAAHYTPTALQLRALGVMHEAVQENATIVLMPNSALSAGDALASVAASAAGNNGPTKH